MLWNVSNVNFRWRMFHLGIIILWHAANYYRFVLTVCGLDLGCVTK